MEFDKVETIFDIDKNLLEKIDEFKNERILKHTNDEGKYNINFFIQYLWMHFPSFQWH